MNCYTASIMMLTSPVRFQARGLNGGSLLGQRFNETTMMMILIPPDREQSSREDFYLHFYRW